jgi:hypothetical protein
MFARKKKETTLLCLSYLEKDINSHLSLHAYTRDFIVKSLTVFSYLSFFFFLFLFHLFFSLSIISITVILLLLITYFIYIYIPSFLSFKLLPNQLFFYDIKKSLDQTIHLFTLSLSIQPIHLI